MTADDYRDMAERSGDYVQAQMLRAAADVIERCQASNSRGAKLPTFVDNAIDIERAAILAILTNAR